MATEILSNPALAEHATAIRALGKRVVDDVIEIGRHLSEAREIAGHGNWLPWLEREFGWSRQTADRLIQVFEASGKLPNLSNLEIPVSGLYLLAAPSTPEAARTEIAKRSRAGEALPVAEVKAIVEKAKGRAQPRHAAENSAPPSKAPKSTPQRPARSAPPKPAEANRNNIGENSAAEAERLRVRNDELQNVNCLQQIKIGALESEIEDAKTARKPKLAPDGSAPLYCSFCGKTNHEVCTLIAGPIVSGPTAVFICDECVDLCADIIKQQRRKKKAAEVAPSGKSKGKRKRSEESQVEDGEPVASEVAS